MVFLREFRRLILDTGPRGPGERAVGSRSSRSTTLVSVKRDGRRDRTYPQTVPRVLLFRKVRMKLAALRYTNSVGERQALFRTTGILVAQGVVLRRARCKVSFSATALP
jgi:hypothetical protein